MFSLEQLTEFLTMNKADFEIIAHDEPILTVEDSGKYFPLEECAPVFVVQADQSLAALIMNAQRGKVNLKSLAAEHGFHTLQLANPKVVAQATGYKTGNLPLIGHNLPCLFDKSLTIHDYIYGGTGDPLQTLKIKPEDVIRLNRMLGFVE
ncbi:aminoacyl-tRNA deacylase [Christensenella timonensis]|uniref:aminoacyl-tRNA deacylase n=1 Tax=Christensenella timonensis TaxID=1816678 RepID=UPI0009EF071E|nr:YbaK/EbsC family protein [Christensenella timonensis]